MSVFPRRILLSLLLLFYGYYYAIGAPKPCTENDFGSTILPCDALTHNRTVVYYLKNTDCSLISTNQIKKPEVLPCDCLPGQGIVNGTCEPCLEGTYGSGGEIIDDWGSWTVNGTIPPPESGLVTYCDLFRSYVQPCNPWKASFFNDTLESGDNSQSRCFGTVLTLRKKFVMPSSYVSFTFRVDGRKCYSRYLGCDGLAFFVDNQQVLGYSGTQFAWRTFKVNVTDGYHLLKWVYRKSCYSFPRQGIVDKAFIRSITLVGTEEPKVGCSRCPSGSYSNTTGASSCNKCTYFTHQPEAGQTNCTACPPDTFSMIGDEICVPLRNCTNDDLINAPGALSTCKMKPDGKLYRRFTPKYSTLRVLNTDRILCKGQSITEPKDTLCRCQPGYKLDHDERTCVQCPVGLHSRDGINCEKCPNGQVALMGKHFYTWTSDKLPDGFTASCAGDCVVKGGWISSGDHIRTSRVIGDVTSYIQSPPFDIVSHIAKINFACAITCNVTESMPRLLGHHLADIPYCNLVFQVWLNDSIVDQINCTKPNGRYIYRPERYRDGRLMKHSYLLKNGTYTFRWVFQQADELKSTSAAFEGKVFNISIIGVKGGSAMNCTKCAGGSYSVSGNTDCSICPTGTFSKPGDASCTPCPKGTFADAPGSPRCLACGATTTSLPTRDGCTTNNCSFSPEKGVFYDLRKLSRVNGSMFEVLNYQRIQNERRPRQRSVPARLSIWPPAYHARFYVNLCTVEHENTSCTFLSSTEGVRKSMPVMACRTFWWGRRDRSLGKVIGFLPRKDIRSGVRVQILHGDKCHNSLNGFNTTIDLVCDMTADVGSPGPENNYTSVYRRPCNYYFVWKSLYACPVCRKQDFEKIVSNCVDGKANVTYARTTPCWGTVDGIIPGVTNITCSSAIARLKTIQAAVNKALIGVGVVVIVVLLFVAGWFFYKHRSIRYKYYSMITRNKPMSKLEEEEEETLGNMYHDTHNIVKA